MSLQDTNATGSQTNRDKSPFRSSGNCNDQLIRDLVKKRGTIKARLTRFTNYLKSLDGIDILPSQKLMDLKLRIQGATCMFNEFNCIQTKLEEEVPDSDLDDQLNQRELFENSYYTELAKAECMIAKSESSTTTSNNSICKNHNLKSVKLPTITMPTFDGSYEHWLEFRDSFLSLVHSSTEISSIQKFHYLKSSLKGSAELVIDSLEFTSDNYQIAWELLLNRYNNSRLLVHNHVRALFNLQSLGKESPVLIRKLIDTVLKNMRSLKVLGEPTDSWDTLIIYIIVSKLDITTEREWEEYKSTLYSETGDSKPGLKVDHLIKFLKNRADMLETLSVSHSKPNHQKQNAQSNTRVHCNVSTDQTQQHKSKANSSKKSCLMCSKTHPLYSCQQFLNTDVKFRLKLVKENGLCLNCLRKGHTVENCRFGPCRLCNSKHNTLVHSDDLNAHTSSASMVSLHGNAERAPAELQQATPSASLATSAHSDTGSIHVNKAHIDNLRCDLSCVYQPVLLSTALIEIADTHKNYHIARALLDSGSQRSFITKKLCDSLTLPLVQSTQEIRGVGNSVTHTTQLCNIEIKSRTDAFNTNLQCFVLPNITSALPSISKQCAQISIPNKITLADPYFYESHDIDILIGADKFWDLLNTNKIRLSSGPFLQDTKLGWIISGPISCNVKHSKYSNCNFTQSIDSQLRKFWELEELPKIQDAYSKEERACEDHFIQTTKRDENGRFCVSIPFKIVPDSLGDTYLMAEKRFLALEKRLERNPSYKKMYLDFIHEYLNLGHMTEVFDYGKPYYFLPHHGVFREHSTTTKLRVVFDASAESTSGKSLNDIQLVGPAIQGDLVAILLRFRQHKYIACADVEKMYRQVLIDKSQRDLLLILWRDDPSQPLRTYQLNTVTYGTASAPFLSCRCLKEVAAGCIDADVSRVITEDMYVDDMITGHDDKSKLILICQETAKALQSACFPLRKWAFNFENDESTQDIFKEFSLDNKVNSKTLGLGFHNQSDEFYFTTQFKSESGIITKRSIMSNVSQVFDPLGLLSPVIITIKVLLQKLWLLKLGWDDEVPSDVAQVWTRFADTLPVLNTIRIPRHALGNNPKCIELHVFTDASEAAYGACLYVRTICNGDDSTIVVKLLCSKSKVAPLKPVSIPRLELCGALLGARLFEKVKDSLRCNFDGIYFWCDSTIVLGWLRMPPTSLKTFVQNRVAEIHEITKDIPWRHVSGKHNPADLVSRGVMLNDLPATNLWWEGPSFLRDTTFDSTKSTSIYRPEIEQEDLPDVKTKKTLALASQSQVPPFSFPFKRYSQYNRMRRSGAYVLRFVYNLRNKNNRRTGSLTVDELKLSDIMLIKQSQIESFPVEYDLLLKDKHIKKNSKLCKLNIFMDENKLLRVGGRIRDSTMFTYAKKHPLLISAKHWFSLLLFRNEHKQLAHAGAQALLYNVRETYWPVGGRDLARQIVHACIVCTRLRGRTLTPIMGNLPQERITPTLPFVRCGVDYAGPVLVLNRKGRGSKLMKSYICIFVCFVTRAVHVELVSDLSTDSYLLALKRFISRRGKPLEIYSDNGRNFVGLMNEFKRFLNQSESKITDFATSHDIKFKLIPVYAPHFGGLWEAGIKSCKHHLLRTVGNAHLTFEELSTVLAQIEAILNSRPLNPLSADPNDFLPLSPSHFLVGRLLTAPAFTDLTEVPASRLTRYQKVEQIRQHFWTRWTKEYISELQTRMKWNEHKPDLQPNTLVVLKEDNSPPLKWSLGRIIATIPGKDGVSRVADIRTASGIVRRAFSKICPLFDEDSVEAGAVKAGGMLQQ